MKRKITYKVFSLCVVLLLFLFGCGDSDSDMQARESEELKSNSENSQDSPYIEIKNGDRVTSFFDVPKRVVTLNQHTTEIMLALGLADRMVGTAYLDDEILPEYKEMYETIPVIADQYPSKESFLEVNPDFAYAGWKSAFEEETIGTEESLERLGIKTYLHQSSNIVGPTADDIYEDIRTIAQIFQVEEKAEQLVQTIKNELAHIQNKIGPIEKPLSVFVYDSGEDAPFTATQNFMTELIRMAGGENIFADIEKNWTNVTWEEVVERNPDIIVIIDYGDIPVENKKQTLLQKSALANVNAIQNDRFTVLPLSAAAEGVRIPIAVETLARSFYPEKFE